MTGAENAQVVITLIWLYVAAHMAVAVACDVVEWLTKRRR